MRMTSIQLKNFGSFQDAAIDLSGISTAVITGQNGAGKSTGFVDAPLWALFGKCRTTPDQMLRLGAIDMAVTLEFELNLQTYRVIRKRSLATKAGKSDLSLQIMNGHSWEDASGARLADTQQKITDLLNSDYELLVSTGVLVQGQADKFSRATPSERKAILAQILRLDQYGPLKQAANRHLTIAEAKHGEKATQLRTLEAEAATVAELEARHAEVSDALSESQRVLKQLEQHQDELTTKKATLAAELEQLTAIPDQISKLQTQRSTVVSSMQVLTGRRDRAAKILANRTTIEAKVIEEQQLQMDFETALREEEELDQAIDALMKDQLAITGSVNQGVLLERESSAALNEIARAIDLYKQESDRLLKEIERAEDTGLLLTNVPCGAGLQAVCQFTLQAVKVQAALPDKRQVYGNRWNATMDNAEHICPEAVAAARVLEGRLTEWEAHQYEAQADQIQQLLTALREKRSNLKVSKDRVQVSIKAAAAYTVLVQELEAAERELKSVDQDLERLDSDQAQIEIDLEQLQARQADRTKVQQDHDDVVRSLQQDVIYLTRLRTDGQTAIGRLKELELEIKHAQDAARQAEQLQQECRQLQTDARQFQALATAYGQIPILILETALPLLEEETNRILGKISTSGLRVTINTQKALKSRDGLAETLDIAVRDVFGERLLENFSGGERARVDLAIRIGLSKLLANRAGARLETLILDEAFAAVDREGVEQLVECLPLLSQEFPLILFVTHDESFKSAIAQQLVVSKGPHGSQVTVVA